MKTKIEKLKNGLTIVYCQDKTRHSFSLELIIKFGGNNRQFIIDNKEYNLTPGYAHFLEHAIIEHNSYQNLLTLFSKKNIDFNGITNSNFTSFYFNCLHNFKKNVEIFLKAIHSKNILEADLIKIKEPILEEINSRKDNNFFRLNKMTSKSLFKIIPDNNICGDVDDINNLNYELLNLCHDVFYTPTNEILFIGGNIDISEMTEFINNIYNSLEFKSYQVMIPDFKEPNEVNKKENYFKTNTSEDYTRITYKLNIKSFNSLERIKLSFYIECMFIDNFSSVSKIYQEILGKHISNFDIDYNINFIEDFLIIEFGLYTNSKEEFINLINNTINNLEFNQDNFDLTKKRSMIDLLLREENFNYFKRCFLDNILVFNYYDYDKINDIESFNFNEYQEVINNLDFSNYTINSFIKK